MWRFLASSISKKKIEGEVELYRFIRIRVRTTNGRVNVSAIMIEDPSEVTDTVGMLEKPQSLGREWNMLEQNGGMIFTNVTSQIYVIALPQDYGAKVLFDYHIIKVKDPKDLNAFTQQAKPTTVEEEDPYFNGYTRKLTSYGLTIIFGLVFFFGLYSIYRTFFSQDARLLADV
jgi:hypothetical protein